MNVLLENFRYLLIIEKFSLIYIICQDPRSGQTNCHFHQLNIVISTASEQ